MNDLEFLELAGTADTEGKKHVILRVALLNKPNYTVEDMVGYAEQLGLSIHPATHLIADPSSNVLSFARANLDELGFDAKVIATIMKYISKRAAGNPVFHSVVQEVKSDKALTIHQKLNEFIFLDAITNGSVKSEVEDMRRLTTMTPETDKPVETLKAYYLVNDVTEDILKRASMFSSHDEIISQDLHNLRTEHLAITPGIEYLINLYVATQSVRYQCLVQPCLNRIPKIKLNEIYSTPTKNYHIETFLQTVLVEEDRYLDYLLKSGVVAEEHVLSLKRLLEKLAYAIS